MMEKRELYEEFQKTKFYWTVSQRYLQLVHGQPKLVQILDDFNASNGNQVDIYLGELLGIDTNKPNPSLNTFIKI